MEIRMMTKIQKALRSNRGAAAVEFALLVPVLATVFIGLANYGLATFERMELESAARAGAQMALIDTSSTSTIQQVVVDSTNADIATTDVTVTESCKCADGTTVTCGNTCGDGSTNQYYMTITATESYTLLLIPTTLTLTGTATVRTE
jgi:Flp pilus assembly protein TadG